MPREPPGRPDGEPPDPVRDGGGAVGAETSDGPRELVAFASTIAHDLRNPLTVARGNLEMARHEGELSAGQAAALDGAETALHRADRIIEDLLTYARNGNQMGPRRPVDLGGLARTVWDELASGAATLDVKLDRPVSGDPTVLRQVFENLFANALQHGGPSVTVTIGELRMLTVPVDGSEGDEPALVGFYVADDGPGIPAELREDLFEMGVSGAGGTGYGLAIVRQFAVDHGWTVSATRSADGGARFEFLGVEPAAETPDATADSGAESGQV